MIKIVQKGDWKKTTRFLERIKELAKHGELDRYGRMGVEALTNATPKDSGETAKSWGYKIEHNRGKSSLIFYNECENDGVIIAIILQYGHATRNGSWVEGRDYINPAIQPIFDLMSDELWKEVIHS